MKKVIIDSNFFLIPFQLKINILAELERLINEPYEIVVPKAVVKELEKISKRRNRDARGAKLALEIIKKNNIRIIDCEGYADDCILKLSKNNIVCTNDIKLKKKIKENGGRVISVRSLKSLDFV